MKPKRRIPRKVIILREIYYLSSVKNPKNISFQAEELRLGTYKSKFGLISADAHGAINILRKVAIQLGISLAEVGRESLVVPQRYKLSDMSKLYRKRVENQFLTVLEASA